MAGPAGRLVNDLRGVAALAVEGVVGVTDLVERMHATIANLSAPLGKPHVEATRGITGFVYRSVRGVARGVGLGLDRALAPFAADTDIDAPQRDHAIAALNGVLGDRLAASGNPLAIAMQLRRDESPPTPRIALFLHGLCMHDGHWPRGAGSADAALRALGWTPVYVRYNSGRGIPDNGRELSAHLDDLVAHWPLRVEEISLVAHSMGGLVARSAAEHARRGDAAWVRALRNVVFLGTPHHGSGLERAGKRVDYLLTVSPYSAPFAALGGARSTGIQDLGHGRVMTDAGHVPLPDDVRAFAVAGSLRLGGDGLVAVDSALGRRGLAFPGKRTLLIDGAGHIELMRHPAMVEALVRWLRPRRAKRA